MLHHCLTCVILSCSRVSWAIWFKTLRELKGNGRFIALVGWELNPKIRDAIDPPSVPVAAWNEMKERDEATSYAFT